MRGYGAGTYGQGAYGGRALDGIARVSIPVDGSAGRVDVACDWRSIAVTRGRSDYLDAMAAGGLQLVLDNPAGAYSPWPPGSMWNVDGYLTSTPIAVAVVIDGAPFPLFTGSTDRIVDAWPSFIDATATVEATDGFKALARNKPSGVAAPPVERSGARVGRILDLNNWTAPRAIDVGLVNVAAQDLSAASLLDSARTVDEAEWGAWYVAADGAATFRQRDAVQTDPRMTAVQAWFVDEHDPTRPGAICYSELRLAADDQRIVNTAIVQRAGKADVSASDAASIAHFKPRTLTLSGSLIVEDAEALNLAQVIVLREKSDDQRVEAVVFSADEPAAAAVAARLRLLDRIGVVRHFPGGWVLECELLVEGIAHDLAPYGDDRRIGTWNVTLSTSTALSISSFGRWDEATWDDNQWGV